MLAELIADGIGSLIHSRALLSLGLIEQRQLHGSPSESWETPIPTRRIPRVIELALLEGRTHRCRTIDPSHVGGSSKARCGSAFRSSYSAQLQVHRAAKTSCSGANAERLDPSDRAARQGRLRDRECQHETWFMRNRLGIAIGYDWSRIEPPSQL